MVEPEAKIKYEYRCGVTAAGFVTHMISTISDTFCADPIAWHPGLLNDTVRLPDPTDLL